VSTDRAAARGIGLRAVGLACSSPSRSRFVALSASEIGTHPGNALLERPPADGAAVTSRPERDHPGGTARNGHNLAGDRRWPTTDSLAAATRRLAVRFFVVAIPSGDLLAQWPLAPAPRPGPGAERHGSPHVREFMGSHLGRRTMVAVWPASSVLRWSCAARRRGRAGRRAASPRSGRKPERRSTLARFPLPPHLTGYRGRYLRFILGFGWLGRRGRHAWATALRGC